MKSLSTTLLRSAVAIGAIATLTLLSGRLGSVKAASSTTFHLIATTCGTWDSAGHHTVGTYQVGHSKEHPNQSTAYFVFDLTPIQGRKVVGANLTIPGTSDFSITDVWANHTPTHQFKVGIAPQNVGAITLNELEHGNNDSTLFINANDANRNQDLGYGWVQDGLHAGFAFDADHYHPERLQAAVNAGGLFAFWACDRFDSGSTGENYVWGNSTFNHGITLNITVQ
jgi:hypothetical protein